MSKPNDYDFLTKHREIWHNKTVLQRLYREQYYQALLENLATGANNLEIGSGPGFLAEIAPSILRTDILFSPYIQMQTDAHKLPFATASLDNIIGLDVLHHFSTPVRVLKEISRVLRQGGRFILVEPYITPFSRLIYTYLHQEECDLSVQPWDETAPLFKPAKEAFDGNAAIPYLLLEKGQAALAKDLPNLQLKKCEKFSLFTYLLSGGFKRYNLLPNAIYPLAYKMEQVTQPLWKDLAALRAVIVWEKT